MIASLADAFLEQSPACNWIVDPALTFCRIYGDPAPILGKTAGELEGRCLTEALDTEAASTWKARLGRALEGEWLSLRDRRGTRTWHISVFPITEENNVCYA